MHSPDRPSGLDPAGFTGVKSLSTDHDHNPQSQHLSAGRAGVSGSPRWVRGPTLARDIAIVLAIKFVLLMALKFAFFNHPQAEHMSLPPEQVAQALLSVPASHPSQGDQHAR